MENMIGQRIKERRKELKITQTQIQQETSISSGNLSCIENGKYLPSAVALLELSKILDCSVDWLLTGEQEEEDISNAERKYISDLRKLDSRDRADILDLVRLKVNRMEQTNKSQEFKIS